VGRLVINELDGLLKDPGHGLIFILSRNMPGETEGKLRVDYRFVTFVPWTPFESPMKPIDPFLENVFECIKWRYTRFIEINEHLWILEQCFSTCPRHQLCRAARGSPGICHFSFLSIFHE
jgi:hypothetical protein